VPGGEPATVEVAERAERDRLRAAAEDLIAGIPGAWIEPKEFGFAATAYRRRRRPRGRERSRRCSWSARRRPGVVAPATASSSTPSAMSGRTPPSRGCAHGATAVLFAGDDVTDEDALASLDAGDVGVRVGAGDTAASVRVDGIPELAGVACASRTSAPPCGIDCENAFRRHPRHGRHQAPLRAVTDGIEATTSRGMLRAVGMGDEDWDKPQIGIASSWNEITPAT
jgi:hypothetical protein